MNLWEPPNTSDRFKTKFLRLKLIEVKMDDVVLSVFEEKGEAIISHRLQGMPTYGNAPFPRASDGHLVDRLFESKEEVFKYVNRFFPHFKIIDKIFELKFPLTKPPDFRIIRADK